MCETRDLGIQWLQWHTLLFEGQVAVDMSVVWPHDVKRMLLEQAKMVFWNKWTATHECEELKRRSLAGANPRDAAKEYQRVMDRQAPQCDE